MAETINRGPTVNAGSLMDGRIESFDGPSIEYQGVVFPDPRFSPLAKDGLAPGRVKGFMASPTFIVVDGIPSNSTSNSIAAAQAGAATTTPAALTLVTAVAGTAAGVPVFAAGVPIIPTNTTVVQTVGAIDFGFATGSTVANSSAVYTNDNTQFYIGQWIVIAGAGTTTNQALITQVASIATANTTGITISPNAASTSLNLPIGQGNLYSPFLPPAASFGPSASSANAAEPYRLAGLAKVFDPAQAITRCITASAASITSGTGSYYISGYDIYGVPMHETITLNGSTQVNGNKAWKYISSIVGTGTPATTGTPANVQFGTGDIIGINMRSDKWEYLDIFYNGGFQITNTGYTQATTVAATATTGDVRGTQNASTGLFGSSSGSAATGGTFNGVKRITITQSIPQQSMLNANPNVQTSLFGVTQF